MRMQLIFFFELFIMHVVERSLSRVAISRDLKQNERNRNIPNTFDPRIKSFGQNPLFYSFPLNIIISPLFSGTKIWQLTRNVTFVLKCGKRTGEIVNINYTVIFSGYFSVFLLLSLISPLLAKIFTFEYLGHKRTYGTLKNSSRDYRIIFQEFSWIISPSFCCAPVLYYDLDTLHRIKNKIYYNLDFKCLI